jgi:hypothetical protein
MLGRDGAIDEEATRGIVTEVAGIDQVSGLSICINMPAADEPSVKKVKARVGWPRHLAVAISDQDGVPLVDDKLKLACRDLTGHGVPQ